MEDNAIRNATKTREDKNGGAVEMQEVSDDDRGGRAWWWRCGTTGMNKVAEDMWDGNIGDVGQRRWQNGLEVRRRTGQIYTGNEYQPEGVLSLRDNED